jgi:hypothetical protein
MIAIARSNHSALVAFLHSDDPCSPLLLLAGFRPSDTQKLGGDLLNRKTTIVR